MSFKSSIEKCISNILMMCNPSKAELIRDDELGGFVMLFHCKDEAHKESLIEYAFYHNLCPAYAVVRCIVDGTELKRYSVEEAEQIVAELLIKHDLSEE